MKIAVINTGGTISCVGEPLAPMTAGEFAVACNRIIDPVLQQQFPDTRLTYLADVLFPESGSTTIDSTNLQPVDWCVMAGGILRHYAAYDGFVVLHGTDSMDFTGAALTFLLNGFDGDGYGTAVLSKPVIITGSQVPMFSRSKRGAELTLNFNTDAFQNFCTAVAAARTGPPEVCVCFQHHLYRGSRVLKTSASGFNAFSSPNYPALADYGVTLTLHTKRWLPGPVHDGVSLDNETVLARQVEAVERIGHTIDRFPVMQFNAFPASYAVRPARSFIADLIGNMMEAGVKGLVLKSYGSGNFPSGNPERPSDGAIYQALRKAHESGINIVNCTQVIAGAVNSDTYAAGSWLTEAGALSAVDMSSRAALVKLMILMASAEGKGWSRKQVRMLLQTNLAGEMISVNSLDSRTNAVLQPGQSIRTLDGSAILTNEKALGPVLVGAGDAVLWRLPVRPSEYELPGRLVMHNDGNLVFYGRSSKPLWATGTVNPSGAASRLTLSGSYDALEPAKSNLLLQVFNYAGQRVSAIIYRFDSEAPHPLA